MALVFDEEKGLSALSSSAIASLKRKELVALLSLYFVAMLVCLVCAATLSCHGCYSVDFIFLSFGIMGFIWEL